MTEVHAQRALRRIAAAAEEPRRDVDGALVFHGGRPSRRERTQGQPARGQDGGPCRGSPVALRAEVAWCTDQAEPLDAARRGRQRQRGRLFEMEAQRVTARQGERFELAAESAAAEAAARGSSQMQARRLYVEMRAGR